MFALEALLAWNRPVQEHSIACFNVSYAFSHFENDAGSFVSEDEMGVLFEGVPVGVANTGSLDLDENLVALRTIDDDVFNGEGTLGVGDGGFGG